MSWGTLTTIAVSAAVTASLYFLHNFALTGDLLSAPHRLWSDHVFGPGADAFGFGPHLGVPLWTNTDPLPGHGLADVVLHANKNFSLMNFELFGWACGSLVFACLGLWSGRWSRRDLLTVGIPVSVIGGHAFYWAPGGPDFGARYWYLLIGPMLILTVKGMETLAGRLAAGPDRGVTRGRVAAFAGAACLGTLLLVMPWRAGAKYHEYREIGRDAQRLLDQQSIRNALIFIRSPRRSDYQAAFNFNPRTLDAPGNVFAWDLGPAHRAPVIAHFPDREIWVFGYAGESERTLEVLAGPVPAGTDPGGVPPTAASSMQAVLR
jgi:hypothetical protein